MQNKTDVAGAWGAEVGSKAVGTLLLLHAGDALVLWGGGSRVFPGRFHVDPRIKLVLQCGSVMLQRVPPDARKTEHFGE